MTQRLNTLDGLRAFAALGVLWIHTWTVHGNPRLKIAGLDITSIMALGGNGVDLFFVISGFCMYFFYSRKPFAKADYFDFLKKRWIRLSPAFYFATCFYIVCRWYENHDYTVIIKRMLTSVFYVNSLSNYNVEAFLWSLSPEWQFYLLIPCIIILQQKYGFKLTFATITTVFALLSIVLISILKKDSDLLTSQLIFRYFEFATGILAAKILAKHNTPLRYRAIWVLGAIITTYLGRTLLSAYVLSLSESYYNIFKLLGFTIMCTGFATIIYLAITSEKYLKALLGNTYISSLGRISYSFYLWHGIVHVTIAHLVIKHVPISGIMAPLLSFCLSIIILIPISSLSFKFLEAPFINSKKSL